MWYNYRYSKDELAAWILKLKEMSQNTDVYGYFNNHYHGYAPENCVDMLDMLGVATSQQKEARQGITDHWKGRGVKKPVTKTLSDFFEQDKKDDIPTLLIGFIEHSRMEKAREIKDIEIIESGSDRIIADIKGYSVYMDLEKRFIPHYCPDWKRTIRERWLCKHIGALVLALPEDRARRVLENIKRQQWELSQYTGRGETY